MISDKNFYPIPQLNTNMHTSKPFQTDNIVNQVHAHLFNKYSKSPLVTLKPMIYQSACIHCKCLMVRWQRTLDLLD